MNTMDDVPNYYKNTFLFNELFNSEKFQRISEEEFLNSDILQFIRNDDPIKDMDDLAFNLFCLDYWGVEILPQHILNFIIECDGGVFLFDHDIIPNISLIKSWNRIIVEYDSKGNVCASVTSSTNEIKSRTALILKNGKISIKHNSFLDEIPVCIMFKAFGIISDQEVFQLVGNDFCNLIIQSVQECYSLNIFNQIFELFYVSFLVFF